MSDASVIYLKNSLCPQNRIVEYIHGGTLLDYDPDWELPYIALVNGQAMMRADWGREIVPGDILAFIDVNAIPQDGGGGGGGSDPLKMVLMIAVMVYAPYLATSMLGAGASAMAVSFATAAIGMAGSMLVNAILPPPTAQTSAQQTASLASPSPTYSLQAQGNSARLESAIPEHFGRLVAYMDFAAQPYVEYSGNEQFLYQILCVGRGEYDIEAIRIEDTAISAFDEITYEVIAPNGHPTLFPSAVVSSIEVSGQDLPCLAATYSQSGTTLTVTLTAHGLSTGKPVYLDVTSGTATDGTYTVTAAPTANTFTVTAASATTSGNVTVSPWLGGFVANASGTTANVLGLDFVMPRGIYYANDNGSLSNVTLAVAAEYRTVDDAGAPTGSWTALGSASYTAGTTTPQRHSERYTVAAARYEVRVRRTDIEQTDTRYGHDVVWAGLRAYLPETLNFGDVTLIAMRMRASNNLSMQASRKVNVIATRKLPIWNGTTWSANTATRSIAWPIAYACKQMGLTDAQIDLATLLALDAVWAARSDYFDARFDNFISFWEAVTKMAGAGRAKPYMQGGIMRIMRDQASTIPVALFSMRNIVKGSFSVDYLMPTADTADAIDVGYFDSGNWAPRRVRAKLPGSTAARPAKIELFGVTDRNHAFREGMYQAGSNRYRRKIIRFTTEMEGFIPSFGDLIAIQHDMPAWGQGGEIVAWDSVNLIATLSEPLTWSPGSTHYIALRKRDGGVDGPYVVTAGVANNQVVLQSVPAITPYTAGAEERTHYTFGWADTWRQPARLLSARPRGLHQIEIEAVNEDDSVHTAETGQTAPAKITSQLNSYTTTPVVAGLTAYSMNNAPDKMLLAWKPSPWADYYLIEQSSDGVAWTRSGEVSSSNFTGAALYGSHTIVRVAAVGLARGPWAQVAYGVNADYMWASNNTALMWTSVDSFLMWRY